MTIILRVWLISLFMVPSILLLSEAFFVVQCWFFAVVAFDKQLMSLTEVLRERDNILILDM